MNENLEKYFNSYSSSHQSHFQQSHTEPETQHKDKASPSPAQLFTREGKFPFY